MAVDSTNKPVNGDGLLLAFQQFISGKLATLLGGKVDKVSGKGLSTNDYTTAEKTKLNGIAAGANNYTHPAHTAYASGLYKVVVDALGHVTSATKAEKADITALGIPGQDTTYGVATDSANGLMSASDYKKLKDFGAASTYATTAAMQTYVGQQISAAGHMTKSIVDTLPAASAAKENVIYLVKKTDGSGDNLYDEYQLVNGALERMGDTSTKIEFLTNAEIAEILSVL